MNNRKMKNEKNLDNFGIKECFEKFMLDDFHFPYDDNLAVLQTSLKGCLRENVIQIVLEKIFDLQGTLFVEIEKWEYNKNSDALIGSAYEDVCKELSIFLNTIV